MSYVAIGIVALLLLLMMTKAVPEYLNVYLLAGSIFLLVVRFGGRTYFLIRDHRVKRKE